MNELTVKTITKEPAKIEFNFDELSDILDQQLEKYEGLEFTEEQVKECKKVITELNKGKTTLSDYRLATKKELSVSITEFEARCKHLSNKFDDVIKPLKEQSDQFEENRKDEKRKQIQVIVDELIENEGLNEKHAAQLIIENSYLNKSTTMKSITDDLGTKAEHLGIAQDKEESDVEIINMSVEIANERYRVSLLESTYIRLLEHEDINDIKKIIIEDAQSELEKREREEKEEVVFAEKVHPEEVYIKQLKNDEVFVEKYKVEGTESELEKLEEYMSSHGLAWSVIEDV